MTPQELFDNNRGLVRHIARRYKVPEEDFEDMIQEGYLTLWKCALGYDEERGRFSAYAGRAIEYTYGRFTTQAWNSSGFSASDETIEAAYKATQGDAVEREGYERLRNTVLSTEYLENRDDEDGATIGDMLPVEDDYSNLDREELRRALQGALDTLDERTRELIEYRFGLNDDECDDLRTFREIGQHFDISHEQARKLIARGIARLRHPRSSSSLSIYAEPED